MSEILSNESTNLFDIMAKIFKKIDILSKVDKENIFRRCQSNITTLDQTVEGKFPFFNKLEKELYYDSVGDGNILMLSSYIDDGDAYDCFLILIYLDRYIKFEPSMKRFFNKCLSIQKGIWLFKALNENGVGILLPRFIPDWAKINNITRAACNAKPFSLIKRYIWCADSGNMEVNHIYVDINPLDKYDVAEPFRIVCSPLVDKCPYEYKVGRENDIDYFYINNYHQNIQNIVIKRIEKTIHYAENMHASVVLFPEMMIDPDNRSKIIQIVKDNWEYFWPKIIFFPSSEYKDGEKWKNQIIVTNDSGDIIYEYNKQRGYQHVIKNGDGSIKEVYFEPISPDHKFTILHLNKIGRVGILICADIFDDEIKYELCNKYDLDVVLISAYTLGWDLFDRCATGMSDTCCDIIVCNACSAIENKKQKSVYPLAYYPLGHNSKREYVKKKCEKDCTGCAFCVEISGDYYDKLDDPVTQEFLI